MGKLVPLSISIGSIGSDTIKMPIRNIGRTPAFGSKDSAGWNDLSIQFTEGSYQCRVELTGKPLAVLSMTTCPLSAENYPEKGTTVSIDAALNLA